MKTVIIDGDSIAYAAGYSADWSIMKRSVDLKINRILRDCNTRDYVIYIEEWRDKKNIFRHRFSSAPYKARKPTKCPLMKEAKDYLLKTWNAKVTNEFEAEDMCVITAYEKGIDNCIVACIDKDLLCHPLTFYNYSDRGNLGRGLGIEIPPNTKYTVSDDEATLHLCRQLLVGDMVDSIPGIKGIGKKRATTLICNPKTALQMAAYVYKQRGMSYNYFIEQYNLLYIRNSRCTELIYPMSRLEYNNLKEIPR